MQIQPLETFTLEDVATGQFFVRSNTIKMSAANTVIPYVDIDFVLQGNWKTTYTFLKVEGNERFCHCVTLLHEDHQIEDGLLHSEPYLVDGQKTFLFRRDQPTRFFDSHYVSVEGMMALNEDILPMPERFLHHERPLFTQVTPEEYVVMHHNGRRSIPCR